MNLPTADKIKQTGATWLEKLVRWNWLTSAMIHSVEIALLFMSLKRLRLEREQIGQILLDLEQLTSHTSFTLEKLFLKQGNEIFAALGLR